MIFDMAKDSPLFSKLIALLSLVVDHGLSLRFHVNNSCRLHFVEFVLQSFLGKLFLLLLGPAEISAPKGEPICNKHIEQANIESKPPVEYDGLHPAAFTLHEDELAPSHQARQHEVEDTHEAADLAQQAPAVDVVH